MSMKCVVQGSETSLLCIRTASVQGLRVSLAFNAVEFQCLGEQAAVCSLLNPGEQNTVMLWCTALLLCKSSTAFRSTEFTSCRYFMTNHFHVPMSPVAFRARSLRFPTLGQAQCRCAAVAQGCCWL